MKAPTSPLLAVQDLTIGFGDAPAVVHEVSFDLQRGQRMGLIGRSGSGKSMIAHAIAGLLPKAAKVRAGSINFLADDLVNDVSEKEDFKVAMNLVNLDEERYRKIRGSAIAMIFQEPQASLNPTMSCGKQLLEALGQYFPDLAPNALKELALSWLEKVRLGNGDRIMNAYPHQLSGGQQQRLLIAMAMAAEPKLLLADEPTTALDTVTELEILKLLRQLTAEQGTALLFISHDLAVVRYIAEDLMVIDQGELIAKGKTKAIIQQSTDERVRQLIKGSARLQFATDFGKSNEQQLATVDHPAKDWNLKLVELGYDYVSKEGFFNRSRKTFSAVKQVNLQLAKGEFLALVGESGCGKTTLSRCVNGLLTGYSGQILLADSRPHTVQTVFQDPAATLNPSFTIAATLREVVRFYHPEATKATIAEKVANALNQVGLEAAQFGHRYPDELSGGQKQRVAIARALAANPSVLICDEAVSALDAELQLEIMTLLRQLKQENALSILFISHDLALVIRYADRIAVMDAGKLVEVATAEAVKRNPQADKTKDLLIAAALQ